MRQILARLTFGLALTTPFVAGCNPLLPWRKDQQPPPPPAATDRKPDVPSLVHYLNENARLASSLKARVVIDAKQGMTAIGVDGYMACQKPRDFRLKAKLIGQPAVDIGSNKDEFWYWISKAKPPYVVHCSYAALATGKIRVPFPFQPDMVLIALGMQEYDATAKFDLKEFRNYLELSQEVTSPQGEKVQRVVVFDRMQVKRPDQPQVIAYVLKDARGKMICQARVQAVQRDGATGATVPSKVSIEWPAQEMKMTMALSDVQVNSITPAQSAGLFSRAELASLESYDLARQALDGPGNLRRAGGETPRR
jgi:hypothetical protein